jgi:mannosidase alpha-like ER degradation enhancer 2
VVGKPTLKLLACATLLLETACATAAPRIGLSPAPGTRSDAADGASGAMSRRVRQAFLHAWNGYRHYAWGHDDLNPISRTPHDWYGESLLMTPVDAYDTMLLMGLDAEAADAKRLILERLSFDRDISVQVFEVTIRLLGGLLSAYQADGDREFLRLATDLADRLLPAFDSPTGMPYRYVNLHTGVTRDPVSNPAEIGTLMLEFGTLSKLTGNPDYYAKAKRSVEEVFRRRSRIGLALLKSWLLFRDGDFHRMWKASIAAVNRYVADQRFGGLWYGQVDMASGRRVSTEFGALEAFLPAVLALGGDRRRAERLMESVYRMWTTFGVEPETLDYSSMTIISPEYQLRPESLESAYYLYSMTGDRRYREMGGTMFEAIDRWTRTDAGFAVLADIRSKEKQDRMHSFVVAETLKYAYLLFAPPETLNLQQVIFNTEAHPLKRVR